MVFVDSSGHNLLRNVRCDDHDVPKAVGKEEDGQG